VPRHRDSDGLHLGQVPAQSLKIPFNFVIWRRSRLFGR
jgi:hypothetical protein